MIEEADAGHIRGQQVRRELDALEVGVDRVREGFHGQGFGKPRHAFDEKMPVAEHAHQEPVDEVVLAHDHPMDLVDHRRDEIAAPQHRIARSRRAERARHARTD